MSNVDTPRSLSFVPPSKVANIQAENERLQRALAIALKLYENDDLTRLGEHLRTAADPWADRDAETYGGGE